MFEREVEIRSNPEFRSSEDVCMASFRPRGKATRVLERRLASKAPGSNQGNTFDRKLQMRR